MDLTLWIAFGAGVASFVSPCCLPLYPSYLSYITGISVTELRAGLQRRSGSARMRTLVHTLFFLLGFSVVFYTLGYGTNVFADWFADYQAHIRRVSAILMLVLGLFLLGLFRPQALMKERKLRFGPVRVRLLGSLIMGIGFSAGWSPCIGPILTMILGMIGSDPGAWFSLTSAYAAGFALPFFVLAYFVGGARWLTRYSGAAMKLGGAVMLVMGLLLLTDRMTRLTIWLNQFAPSWMG
ncbi:cytochrome c biogenesis protein CcdA [Paenibacillus sp. IB182496]|uniref:Cytochrome c biogenesis protein CcdA n=1 Tax=Paenibacillus sabuli TaxID=2772509 RepID=A0A927BUW0_9BACL|nr:cytochrome c biogenesis protein CcdA [Paenibacillus sabuli]MBD2847271.1 cytochrome c biogenesis protein CcdA [Paenibacillus sabuli]